MQVMYKRQYTQIIEQCICWCYLSYLHCVWILQWQCMLRKNTEGVFPPREFRLRVYFHMFTRQNVKLVVFQVFLCIVKGKQYVTLTNKTFLRWFREDHISTHRIASHALFCKCFMFTNRCTYYWSQKILKFTLKFILKCPYMFRSMTIIRELVFQPS